MSAKYLSIVFLMLSFVVFGHQVVVHEEITSHAVQSVLEMSFCYTDFLNNVSSDCGPANAAEWMIIGSRHEDDADMDAGGTRSYNHFYDPLDTVYGKGLSDFPPDSRLLMGTNSFAWAAKSNSVGYNFNYHQIKAISNLNTSNVWAWRNARGYEWLALTSSSQNDRTNHYNMMFRALGQTIHLLEDCSQPQHVRNEQHLDYPLEWLIPFYGTPTPWISPIEIYGFNHWKTLNYGNAMLDWRGLGFVKMHDFWDRGLYNGNADALTADAEGGQQLGLAEFCNGNFLGDRHQYAEYYPQFINGTKNVEWYPYPSRTGTDYKQVVSDPSAFVDTVTLANGDQINRAYIEKTGEGVTVTHHSALKYFAFIFPHSPFHSSTTIRDNLVLYDYHNILIPKAEEYAAGLLDYYFRGTIDITQVSQGSSTVGLTVQNTSGQVFGGAEDQGAFYLYQDDSSGTRTQVGQQTLYNSIPNGGVVNLSFSIIAFSGTAKFTLIYVGPIGIDNIGRPFDPVDRNISIAVKSFTLGVPPSGGSDGIGCDPNPAAVTLTSVTGTPVNGHSGSFNVSSPSSDITRNTSANFYATNPTDCGIPLNVTVSGWGNFLISDGSPGTAAFVGLNNQNIGGAGGDAGDSVNVSGSVTIPANYTNFPVNLTFNVKGGSFSGTYSISY